MHYYQTMSWIITKYSELFCDSKQYDCPRLCVIVCVCVCVRKFHINWLHLS